MFTIKTKIAQNQGVLYVNDDFVDQYNSHSEWGKYLTTSINNYPLNDRQIFELYDEKYSTISDSWEDIITNTTDYKTRYQIGDTKALYTEGFGWFLMELVAFDTDEKSDGTGKAAMTWIPTQIVCYIPFGKMDKAKVANDYLNTRYYNSIESIVKQSIVSVEKEIHNFNDSEKIWIPSYSELYSQNGIEKLYVLNTTDKKYKGSASGYSLRYFSNSGDQLMRSSTGNITLAAETSVGGLPCFCTDANTYYQNKLIASIDDGTYKSKYKVGDKIPVGVDGNTYHAVIVGIDKDVDENGDTIPMSFILEELLVDDIKMNSTATNAGGWASSEARATVAEYKQKISVDIQNRLIAAKKVSFDYDTNAEQITYDELWIPSLQEMGGTNPQNRLETTGVIYEIFNDDYARMKHKLDNTNQSYYHTRTAYYGYNNGFYVISNTGKCENGVSNNNKGIALGFCLGKKNQEQQVWDKLRIAIKNGTYSQTYKIGDEFPYTTTEGNTYTAVIVAFDTDVDENGNTIPITFMNKEVWKDTSYMNNRNLENNWGKSDMRRNIIAYKSTFPAFVANGIISAKKQSFNRETQSDLTTYDELWIPSVQELGLGGEATGVIYDEYYKNDASRKKCIFTFPNLTKTYQIYWTRSLKSSSSGFNLIDVDGKLSTGYYSNNIMLGVALGFCYGKHTEEKKLWQDLYNSISHGTHAKDYSIGDEIPYTTTDGDTYHAVIVAFDKDVDKDGNSVPVSFVTKELWKTKHKMNSTTNTNYWASTEMRTITLPTIFTKLPDYVTSNIVNVKKVNGYFKNDTVEEQITIDTLWIPSLKEVNGGVESSEKNGVTYDYFIYANNLSKNILGESSTADWWLRTCPSRSNYFYYVSGAINMVGGNSGANTDRGIALGFCVGASTPSNWDKLSDAISADTYKTQYHVGDEIPYTTSDGSIYTAIVAGIDKDLDLNNNVIPISFITKELYKESNIMDTQNTKISGWRDSALRITYIDEIKKNLPDYITNNVVLAKKISSYLSSKQITYDDIWIPSAKELNLPLVNEAQGITYDLFTNNTSRVKSGTYWLRSMYDRTNYDIVDASGNISSDDPTNVNGIVLGFAYDSPERRAWITLYDRIYDGTYKYYYSVGDEFPYITKDGDKYTAVIVGIDKDIDASGNKIPISFINKELWNPKCKLNSTSKTGGWVNTDLRNTILPGIKAKLPSYIMNNIVPSKKVFINDKRTEQSVYDGLWIPSLQEVNGPSKTIVETTGIVYDEAFTDNASRAKLMVDGSDYPSWWLRTNHDENIRSVAPDGAFSYVNDTSTIGIALGFCIGVGEYGKWFKLFSSIVNGTYKKDFHVGDEFPYTTSDGDTYTAVIVGMDVDEDEDGNKIAVSFINKELWKGEYRMNPTASNSVGWAQTEMRNTTLPGIKGKLPSYLTNRIVSAKKVSLGSETTYDDVWLPSMQEVGYTNYETTGITYTEVYNGSLESRVKKVLGTNLSPNYWLRSAVVSHSNIWSIRSNGAGDGQDPRNLYSFALGFCIGKVTEEERWKNLATSIVKGTYKSIYKVGDLIPYTTTDGDTYHAEIVGIDVDEDKQGNKIPISFITKELWKTSYRMNPTDTNTGGWAETEMRNTTLPMIKEKLPYYIVNHLVFAKKTSYIYNTSNNQVTYDDLWIPSYKELGSSVFESSGQIYSIKSGEKKSIINQNAYIWWTRSSSKQTSSNFMGISDVGEFGQSGNGAITPYGVAIGFCIG